MLIWFLVGEERLFKADLHLNLNSHNLLNIALFKTTLRELENNDHLIKQLVLGFTHLSYSRISGFPRTVFANFTPSIVIFQVMVPLVGCFVINPLAVNLLKPRERAAFSIRPPFFAGKYLRITSSEQWAFVENRVARAIATNKSYSMGSRSLMLNSLPGSKRLNEVI